ncbi:MAG TPA: glycosyltransferase family 39 protein [Anaerolineales bacterium]|nr:glycosyltransferase family 39 protein [Anaerolineales bacterium]
MINLLKTDGICLLVLLALPWLFFWQTWLPLGQPQLAFEDGDFHEQMYPNRVFTASQYHYFRLPMWDEQVYAGFSAVGEPQHAIFYPPGWWLALFPPPFPVQALQTEVLLHLGWAGIGMYYLLKKLTGQRSAALFGGLVWNGSGLLNSYPMLQVQILEAQVWLPFIWLCLLYAHQRSHWRYAVWAGVLWGVSILAGHPQTSAYIAIAAVALLLSQALQKPFVSLRNLLLFVIFGVGVGAVQWLATYQLLKSSARPLYSYLELAGGFRWYQLSNFIVPNEPEWNYLYIGLVALTMVAWALVKQWRKVGLWLGLAMFALLLSMGGNAPLFPLLYALLGRLYIFRHQESIVLVTVACLAVLAGLGFSALRSALPAKYALPVLILLLALQLPDTYRARGNILQVRPAGGFFQKTAVQQVLAGIPYDGRVSSENSLQGKGNAGKVFGFRDINGISPLLPANIEKMWQVWDETRVFQLLDVQFLITPRTLSHAGLLLVHHDPQNQLNLYQVFLGSSPAWIVHDAQLAPDGDTAMQSAADPALNVFETAILEQTPQPSPEPLTGAETVRLTRIRPTQIQVDVQLNSPGVVVVSEMNAPGWVVTANGEPVTELRAYGILRAVALPAGTHQLVWNYQPMWVWLGGSISLISVLIALGLWLFRQLPNRLSP